MSVSVCVCARVYLGVEVGVESCSDECMGERGTERLPVLEEGVVNAGVLVFSRELFNMSRGSDAGLS